MAIYQKRDVMARRVIPLPAPNGDFGVCAPTTLAAEGYYTEYDVAWPLLPEHPLQPDMLSAYIFAANPGFTAGEIIAGQAGFDIQEINFTGALPDPPFVRGELITDAGIGGGTAIIGRRYSDGARYLVYNVTAGWSAGGPVTGALGGGGISPGVVSSHNSITAKMDSVHWKEPEKLFFRENMGLFPVGSRIRGMTSAINATVTGVEPPYMVAELSQLFNQLDTVEAPANLMFKIVILYGDLAQLMYDLGAAADYGQRRAVRNELVWMADVPHTALESSASTTFPLGLMQLSGRWGRTIPAPIVATTPTDMFFRDGFVLRCYVSGGGGALPATAVFTRQLTFNEYWQFQSVQFRNGQ